MNGLELAEVVQASNPEVKFLYMSGYSGDLITRHGITKFDSPLLAKPFTVDALRLKVREVLDASGSDTD
jgi:two-component system, cell cycle sensor histidine kinase and response regulator CckA